MNKQEHEALRLCVESLDQLMPYLAKVPADVGLLNDALVAARPLVESGPAPASDEQSPEQMLSREQIENIARKVHGECIRLPGATYQHAAEAAVMYTLERIARPAQTEQQPLIFINPMVVDELEGRRKPSPGGLTWSRKACAHWTFPLYAAPVAQTAPQGKFAMGDRVKKTSGSEWVGHICGTYSTALTPEGYAVESEAHAGSVQIYPDKALEAAPEE